MEAVFLAVAPGRRAAEEAGVTLHVRGFSAALRRVAEFAGFEDLLSDK
jgi:hypothetical protein